MSEASSINAPATPGEPRQKGRSFYNKLWNFLTSPIIFVVLSLLWCLDLAIGSIVAYNRDPQFAQKMDSVPFNVWFERFAPLELPWSAWVYILVWLTWLVMISLLLCSIGWFMQRRKRNRTMAEVLLHLGFMLVFIGFVIGSGWGQRAQGIQSRAGQVVTIEELGVRLSLEEVEIVRDDQGNELETISRLRLLDEDGELLVSGTARLNNPLIHGSTVVYPNGGANLVGGAIIDIGEWGEVMVSIDEPYQLPGGLEFRVLGLLQDGQVEEGRMGPGAFIGLGQSGSGMTASAFVGARGPSRQVRLGNFTATWKEPVMIDVARFNVHRDPGVQWVLVGAIVLGLGTLWAMAGFIRRT